MPNRSLYLFLYLMDVLPIGATDKMNSSESNRIAMRKQTV